MQSRSPLWDDYYNSIDKTAEYKVVIGSDEYYKPNLYSIAVSGGLCPEEAFSIGNVMARKLNIIILPKETPIPKMANVEVYMRYNGADGPTEWLPKGKFYIDTRQKSNGKLKLECYDKVLMMEKPFLQEDEELPEFPMLMVDALEIICDRLDLELDNPEAINDELYIEYPNELTMREVAGYIASANAGNFIITDEGKLRLVVPANGTSVETIAYKGFEEINDTWTVSRVTIYYDEENYFTAGDDTADELSFTNPWATQAMANHVLSILGGYTHKPFTCTGAYINPAAELGDTVTMGAFSGVIFTANIRLGASVVWDISSPGETALEHEYPYEGTYARALKNKASLGTPYHGVTISRKEGLKIALSDGSAEAIFNSTMLAMRALKDGVMVDALSFDPVTGKYKFVGDIVMEGGTISWENIDPDTIPEDIGMSEEQITTIARNEISTAKIRVDNITANDVENPIIELFEAGAVGADNVVTDGAPAIDATYNLRQGIGHAIRFKWNDENYILVKTNSSVFYFTNDNANNRPNIRPDGFYVGSKKIGTPASSTKITYRPDGSGFDTLIDGVSDSWEWEKDGSGRITKLTSASGRVVEVEL